MGRFASPKETTVRSFLAAIALVSVTSTADAATLYRAMFVRAAPGRLLDIIALYKERIPVFEAAGDEPPLWMRHSQGDQWDLMLLFPMESFTEYFDKERVARRASAAQEQGLPAPSDFRQMVRERMAWHEEVFVEGPSVEDLKKAFEGAGLFHIEMFTALAGKQAELRREREMENAFLDKIGRPRTLIFTHVEGAGWDLFTIGVYRDLKHFAESGDVPREKLETAARAAGFLGVDAIGPFLRTLIATHHDTLAVPVK
jgi:hypothetical protein